MARLAQRTAAVFTLAAATALLRFGGPRSPAAAAAAAATTDGRCASPPDGAYVCDTENGTRPMSYAYFAGESHCRHNTKAHYAPAGSCDCGRAAGANHFWNAADCHEACIGPVAAAQRCAARADDGFACKCSVPAVRWRYDSTARLCLNFTYTGCGSHGNVFDTAAQCNDACYALMCDESPWPPWAPCIRLTGGGGNAMKPQVGDTLVLWYYVTSGPAAGTGRCEPLVWRVARLDAGQGGRCECGRNHNVYFNQYDCERACAARIADSVLDQKDRCGQPMDEGFDCDCYPSGDYWYWNTGSHAADQFHYRGCGGNGNRFVEKRACEQLCW